MNIKNMRFHEITELYRYWKEIIVEVFAAVPIEAESPVDSQL